MDTEQFPIKIGRITRAVETALNLSLASDVHVYLGKAELDLWIKERPDSYLKMLEEIADAIKKPDFISYDGKAKRFYYLRFYFKGVHLKAALITILQRGEPRKWRLEGLKAISLAQVEELQRRFC